MLESAQLHFGQVTCNRVFCLSVSHSSTTLPSFGFVQIMESPEFKSHFPGLESRGIRPRSWKVTEMRIAGVAYSWICGPLVLQCTVKVSLAVLKIVLRVVQGSGKSWKKHSTNDTRKSWKTTRDVYEPWFRVSLWEEHLACKNSVLVCWVIWLELCHHRCHLHHLFLQY